MSSLTSKVKDGWARWKLAHFYMRDLQDVDVSSSPPADGDTFLWVDADKKWEPGGESAGGGRVNGARDRYTIANIVTTVYALSFVPRDNTLNLFLNGLALDEGIDYTVNYTAPSITLTATAVRAVGDILWARYLTATPAATQIQTTLIWGIRSTAATVIGAFDAVALVDTGVAFADASAHLDPGSGEIVMVFGCQNLLPAGVDGEYLFLRVGTSPGLYHFTRVAGVDNDALIQSISLTGAGDYAVTASGTTVTTKKGGVTQDVTTLTGSDAAALSHTIVGLRGTHGTAIAATNFTAAGGTVTDAFSRPDADQLGHADTGQSWVGTA